MKVKLLTGRAGYSCQNEPGDIIEVSNSEGKALIASGSAEPVTQQETTDARGYTRRETSKR